MRTRSPQIHIRIQAEAIDVAAEYAALHAPESGGRVVFTGCVRPEEGERIIDRLDYEHYSGMAERELEKLAAEAVERWGLNAVRIVHRVGRFRWRRSRCRLRWGRGTGRRRSRPRDF